MEPTCSDPSSVPFLILSASSDHGDTDHSLKALQQPPHITGAQPTSCRLSLPIPALTPTPPTPTSYPTLFLPLLPEQPSTHMGTYKGDQEGIPALGMNL